MVVGGDPVSKEQTFHPLPFPVTVTPPTVDFRGPPHRVQGRLRVHLLIKRGTGVVLCVEHLSILFPHVKIRPGINTKQETFRAYGYSFT